MQYPSGDCLLPKKVTLLLLGASSQQLPLQTFFPIRLKGCQITNPHVKAPPPEFSTIWLIVDHPADQKQVL
jgi:hypothetical protein